MIDWILSSPRILEVPDRLTDVTSWHRHVPFAFWCVEALKPRVLVELGTHRGDSYSAFCQAVAGAGLPTACCAVDTWRGDPQAGEYGEEVYEDFCQYHDSRFASFSRLLRCTFDEATAHFAAGSIDLLHIDGLHTYDAARHDFETWAPRLSDSAVVLFHDVDVRERDFGVWRLWEELCRERPSFTFHHGHGLGVLLVGPEAPAPARRLTESKPAEVTEIRELFARLGDAVAVRGRLLVLETEQRKAERRIRELTEESARRQREQADRHQKEVSELTIQLERVASQLAADQERTRQVAADLAKREAECRRLRGRLASESAVLAQQQLENRQLREYLERARQPRGARRLWDSVRRRFVVHRLAASGLFDAEYYRRTSPDLGKELNPLRHYVKYGVWRGRNPHPMFDTAFYLRENPEVARRGANPLLHFALTGASQGLRPHPQHTADEYLQEARTRLARSAAAAEPAARRRGADAASRILRFETRPLPGVRSPSAPDGAPHPVAITMVACHVVPYPPRAGNEYRIHRMIRWLRSIGHEVHLLVCPLPGEEPHRDAIDLAAREYPNLVICGRDGSVLYGAQRSQVRAALAALSGERARTFPAVGTRHPDRLASVEQTFCPDHFIDLLLRLTEAIGPDIVISNYVFMSRWLTLLPERTLKVIDTHDVFSTKARKVVQFGISDDLALSAQEEGALLRRGDLVIAIQPDEERELREIVPGRRVVTAGVDFEIAGKSSVPADPNVLYVGSGNALNVRGIRDFIALAWPLIRRERPDARLMVAGPVCDGLDGGADGIELLGRVDRLEDAYAAARVVINPAAAGTGLKIKTLEALSNLRRIVVWPSGVDGLSAELRGLCAVADDWYGFARKVLHLLADDAAGELAARRDDLARQLSAASVYRALGAALDRPGGASGNQARER